jgi:hypothetical protein
MLRVDTERRFLPRFKNRGLAPSNVSRREIRRGRRKEMAHIDRVAKARLDSVSSGKLLKLKDGLYRQLKEREWIFNRTENNLVFLIHKEGAYGVVVRNDDIDWNERH